MHLKLQNTNNKININQMHKIFYVAWKKVMDKRLLVSKKDRKHHGFR